MATKKITSEEMATFLRQYGRKAQKGREPNDRWYHRNLEEALKKLKPEELDALINGDGESDSK